jgi:hypothetical protein
MWRELLNVLLPSKMWKPILLNYSNDKKKKLIPEADGVNLIKILLAAFLAKK